MKHCCYCDEFNGHDAPQNAYASELKKQFPLTRVIAQNDDWVIVPTLGCFVPAYVIAITKTHTNALFHSDPSVLASLSGVIESLRAFYRGTLQAEMCFFEHGTVHEEQLSSASVIHTHLHFMPADKGVWQHLCDKYGFCHHPLQSLQDLKQLVCDKGISNYFLFGNVDKKIDVVDASAGNYGSQFLRKAMYQYHYGVCDDGWNWKTHPEFDTMKTTKRLFESFKLD